MARRSSALSTLVVEMSANHARLADDLGKARRATQQVAGQMASAFTSVRRAIVGIGAAFGTIGVAQGLRSIVNASLEFESSFAGVRKTVDATEQELQSIANQFIELSKAIPVTTTELNKIGEAAGQLGIETKNIVGFTKVMADLGVTTNLSSDEAATSLARLANITQLPQENFDRLGSVIVALGNNMATTESEIVSMGLRLAGAGKQIGLTEGQTLAFAAALSSVGVEAEAGGSAISKLFVQMAQAVATGNSELGRFAKVAGVSASEFQQAFQSDAAGAIVSFVEGLNRISESGGNVFKALENLGITEVRMRDAILRSAGAGDLLRESLQLQDQAWKDNNALTEEAAKRYATAQSQLEIFRNKLTDVGRQLGNVVVPVMIKFLEVTESTVIAVNQLKVAVGAFFATLAFQRLAASTAAIKAFGNAVAAIQILGTVRSLAGLKTALLAIVPAAGAAAVAIKTFGIAVAAAAVAKLSVESFRFVKAQREMHDTMRGLDQATNTLAATLRDKYGVEISRTGKTLEQWNKEVVAAAMQHTGLSKRLEEAAEAARLKQEADAKASAAAAKHAQEVEADAEQLEQWTKSFQEALRPASELNKQLVALSQTGKSNADLIKIYGEELSAAVSAQRAHGQSIPAFIAQLAQEREERRQLVQGMRAQIEQQFRLAAAPILTQEAIDRLADMKLGVQELTPELAELGEIWPIAMAPAAIAVQEVDEAFRILGQKSTFELQGIADAAEDAYNKSGLAAERGTARELRARLVMLEAQKEAIIAAGELWSEANEKMVTDAVKALEKLEKQGTRTQNLFKNVGDVVTSALEDSIIKLEGIRDIIAGLLEDIARMILRSQVTQPIVGAIGNVIGGLLGGIGAPTAAAVATPAVAPPPVLFNGGLALTADGATEGVFVQNQDRAIEHTRPTETTVIYNVDATGAGPGTEERIRQALRDVEDRAVLRAVRTTRELQLRTT